MESMGCSHWRIIGYKDIFELNKLFMIDYIWLRLWISWDWGGAGLSDVLHREHSYSDLSSYT